MEYGYKITTKARRDLVRIWKYIAKDDVVQATRFREELLVAAESLQLFPFRHGSLFHRATVRKYPYKSYLIFYKINEETRSIEILRFWHAARNQKRLRLKEENPAYNASPGELELRRHQVASGEGAVIPGDEALLQQAQSQQ